MNDSTPLDALAMGNPDETQSKKFFSLNAISIATFLGSPLAAGILLRSNYVQDGQIQRGNYALLAGVAATLLLFIGIFSLPEKIIARIPNYVISISYTLVTYFVAKHLQGDRLNRHAAQKGTFHSGWRAAGVAVIAVIIIVICFACVAFLFGDLFDSEL